MSRPYRVAAAAALSSFVVAGALALAPAATAATSATSASATTSAASVVRARPPFPGKSASQIKKISVAVGRKATAFHVTGYEITSSGRADFSLDVSPGSAAGTVRAKDVTLDLRRIGKALYLGRDGTWVQTTVDNKTYKVLGDLTLPATWLNRISKLPVTQRKPGPKVGGVPTVTLNLPGKRGGTMSISATGPAYPLVVAWRNKSGRLAFTAWNTAFSVEAPQVDAAAA